MDILKNFLWKIGNFFLGIIRVLRKAICCRKKKDYLLPVHMTNSYSSAVGCPSYNFESQWEVWPNKVNAPLTSNDNLNDERANEFREQLKESNPDDFFKDMVPQIRKPKKIFIRQEEEQQQQRGTSNRLAMDPKAILTGPDLGIIEENSTNWEDYDDADELVDPNQLIRENKRIEREKRLAEHQKRKEEMDKKRALKQEMLVNIAALNMSDDKAKFS